MAIRARAARWFELVVPRSDAGDAMEALAREGAVQFEWRGEQPASGAIGMLDEPLGRYRRLSAAYAHHWPEPVYRQRCCTLPVEASAEASIRQLERWREQAAPKLDRLGTITAELDTMDLWRRILAAMVSAGTSIDLGALARCGPALAGYCIVWPNGDRGQHLDIGASGLDLDLELDGGARARIGIAPAERLPALAAGAHTGGGLTLPIPDWLGPDPAASLHALERAQPERRREAERIESQLRDLADRRGLHHARGTLERIAWFRDAASNIHCDGDYCWITGWTSANEEDAMTGALRRVGVDADLVLTRPPEDAAMPSVTEHSFWLRPFEILTRAVGVPGTAEADPTTWLAVLVPLMFGYMCGDIGHGLVIVAMGLVLIGRTSLWPLLVWCGLAATGFGFVYGDVFGYEGLIEPLWLHPLDDPLTVLFVPMGGGALVLTLGVVLHTVQTCWRGQGVSHGVADIGQLLVYWGSLGAFFDLRAGWLVLCGVLVCAVNRLLRDSSPLGLLAGLAALLESTFTLLLNTLSFARIGAFALAHAALESAIMSTAEAMGTWALAALVVVIGNLVVIALETLVVSIQTSRLVLYEFLTRFFEGQGRPFEPATRPPGSGSVGR